MLLFKKDHFLTHYLNYKRIYKNYILFYTQVVYKTEADTPTKSGITVPHIILADHQGHHFKQKQHLSSMMETNGIQYFLAKKCKKYSMAKHPAQHKALDDTLQTDLHQKSVSYDSFHLCCAQY